MHYMVVGTCLSYEIKAAPYLVKNKSFRGGNWSDFQGAGLGDGLWRPYAAQTT